MRRAVSFFLVNLISIGLGAELAVTQEREDRSVSTAGQSAETGSGWAADKPGRRYRIDIANLPPPFQTRPVANPPRVVPRPANQLPEVPPGFYVELFAQGLTEPRLIRAAPNGDLFVAESDVGRVRVLRPSEDGSRPAKIEIFASGLDEPFGIAFYPLGPEPRWVYIAETNRVVRYAYKNGDVKAEAMPEVVVPKLAPAGEGGHVTRDIAFSNDGKQMFVSVGSGSNDGEDMSRKNPEAVRRWQAHQALGAAWDDEYRRANVLIYTPDGQGGDIYATGIRNCVGLAVHSQTGDLYCSTNERDGLGDNLVPDYVTRVRQGAFYGWPWWYMGNRQDPRWKGARLDLAGKITDPDVPIQSHSAPLQMTFYNGGMFPADYNNSAFAALHGSWNRSERTGYKVVRILMRDGVPTGEYEDFLTGFVIDNRRVWGRPVGVATGKDGSLFVSEDGNSTIWRVSYGGGPQR